MTSPLPDDPRSTAAPQPPADDAVVDPAEESEPTAEAAPSAEAEPTPDDDGERVVIADVADASRVRRAPRYGSFAFAGVVVGGLVALALVQFRALRVVIPPPGPSLDASGLFLLTWVILGTFGAFAGLCVALWLDRRSMRKR